MDIQKDAKLQTILQAWQQGTVATTGWLAEYGISRQLCRRYLQGGWITSVGHSAYQKRGDSITWQGGLYAIQKQTHLPIHAGALTAFSLHGMTHYIRMSTADIFLFANAKTRLPLWFKQHDWNAKLHYISTSMLPETLGLVEYEAKTFTIHISTPERAMLECLHLAPDKFDLIEAYQLMEGLTTLRPRLLQSLLEQCNSIKVKRLFLYMAKKAKHEWFHRLSIDKLDLGTGSRTITKGIYDADFGITIPKELHTL